MKWKVLSALALLTTCAGAPANAQPQGTGCDVHVYPAQGVHSVGDDMDNVHELDQDLRHYNEMAGRPLDWLTPARQLDLLRSVSTSATTALGLSTATFHPEPLTRREALEPGPRIGGDGCTVEILVPQIWLERGALATRSLRVFGIVRRYERSALVQSYSGYAAAPMAGFQMRTPADEQAATQLVESSYIAAVETLLRNAEKVKSK